MRARTRARDTGFQEYMARSWPRLLRTAYLLTGEQHAAEDLAQTTLERAYVAWRRVSAADSPDAYVRRILVNAHARRLRRRGGPELPIGLDPEPAGAAPPARDGTAQADDRVVLRRALRQLPVRQRQAVVLRYWEDLSESDVAAAMGCSVGTVKSQAAKGLAKLRRTPALSGLAAGQEGGGS